MDIQPMAEPSYAGAKEKMKRLYTLQVEGTKGLYCDIGYFMRMIFWETLSDDNLQSKINSATTDCEVVEIYKYVMGLMNCYIKNLEGKPAIENLNIMIDNRDRIEQSYADDPRKFVIDLRKCFKAEQVILQSHSSLMLQGNSNMMPEVASFIDVQTGEEMELGQPPAYLDQSISSFPELANIPNQQAGYSKICFDYGFIDDLQDIFNQFEYKQQYKMDLEREYTMKCQAQTSSAEIENLNKRRRDGNQKFIEIANDLLNELSKCVINLKDMRDKYLQYQALMEVKLLQREELEPHLEIVFGRFAGFLNKLISVYKLRDTRLDRIIIFFFDLCIVVKEQPPDFIFVDNEKKGEKSKAESSGAGKSKTAKTFCTKKKESISTSLLILGYSNLSTFFVKKEEILLKTEEGHQCGQLSYPNYELDKESGELSFKEIKIYGYERRGPANINNQFVRLCFSLTLSCFEQNHEITVKSLPFFLCTGAVQELELIGSRMWYIGSNKNMYDGCIQYEELEPEKVKDILDQRIQSVGQFGGRKLSLGAREFLQNLIPGQQATGRGQRPKNITLHSLVKNKGKKDDKKPSEKVFSFFTWFYALVHTIEAYLLEPWKHGVIYDLMTKEEAEQVLLADSVKCNTALLRPARSFVLKPNCKDALIKVAVEIKRHIDDEDVVQVVNLDMKYIKDNSLHGALDSITDENDETPVIKYILTSKGTIPLDDLRHFDQNTSEDTKDQYHNTVVQQVANIRLQCSGRPSSIPPAKMTKYDQGNLPHKRKSSRQTSLNSSSSNWSMGVSPNSTLEDSNSGALSGMNTWFHRGDSRSPSASSTGSTTFGLSPSNLERLNSNEAQEVKKEIVDGSSQSPKRNQEWKNFGRGVEVDVSGIPPVGAEATKMLPNNDQLPLNVAITTRDAVGEMSNGQALMTSPMMHAQVSVMPGTMADEQPQVSHPSYWSNHFANGMLQINSDLPLGITDVMECIQEDENSHFLHSPPPVSNEMAVNRIAEMLQNTGDGVQRASHALCH